MGFKENFRDELSYQGLLVKEVAAKAGLNPYTLSNYLRENSSVPSADIAVKLAGALGVTVESLVPGK
ncbi:MAG: helix-turn-helix domain-containing protein, partial [Treponemataceae bacterium]|nr:helix-turn-helix domain-containing protein [Treponemataceae bacterium]